MAAAKTKPKTMLVRIIPPNKRTGHMAETYTLSGSGYPKFDWRRGWYEVDLATARKLENARNNPLDYSSKPVFQVVTKGEAEALDVTEKQVKAEATAPIPLPQKVHTPNRTEVKHSSETNPTDEEMDLSDDDSDEDWEALTKTDDPPEHEAQETASADDLADLDDLIKDDAPAEPKLVAKKKAKKRVTKKKTKKTGSN